MVGVTNQYWAIVCVCVYVCVRACVRACMHVCNYVSVRIYTTEPETLLLTSLPTQCVPQPATVPGHSCGLHVLCSFFHTQSSLPCVY